MIPFLKPGDKVAITASASKVNLEDTIQGIEILKSWGLEPILGSTVGNAFHNFSDTRENRLAEMQTFLDNPQIKCIIAARGGYGVSDLLDLLDFTEFKKSPKWLVGFSDLTAIILHLNKLSFPAIHGPMVKTFSFDEKSNDFLKSLLFGLEVNYSWNSLFKNKTGNSEGIAVGGNLALLVHCICTKSDISYDNKILFIEDIGEKMYNIDRMMVQLKRAGKLKNLVGLVVGDFSDIGENDIPFGKTIQEIVLDHCQNYHFPIAFNFPFGHEKINFPIMMGERYKLEVGKNQVDLIMHRNELV